MKLEIQSPFDMHLHLRDGEILRDVVNYTSSQFCGAVVMPNLNPPITSVKLALEYKTRILNSSKYDFSPFVSLYLTEELDKEELQKAKDNGLFMLKLYPKGATTGSENGVKEILSDKVLEILEVAENFGFILSIHGETNGFVLDREFEFLPIFESLAKTFPKLKIIFEHLSDRRSIELVERYDNLYATLTLHHMLLSLDDVLGGMLNPHYFCKPILKTPKDKETLLNIALNAHDKFSFGSDSAPHLISKKECNNGAAGIFSAPILLPKLAEVFEKHDSLENLEKFVSLNATKIYNLNRSNRKITLIKQELKVSKIYNDIVPLFAGDSMSWSLEQ